MVLFFLHMDTRHYTPGSFYRSLSQSVRFCQHCPDHPPALSLPSSRSKPLTGVTPAWQSRWKKDLSLGNQPPGNQDEKRPFTMQSTPWQSGREKCFHRVMNSQMERPLARQSTSWQFERRKPLVATNPQPLATG